MKFKSICFGGYVVVIIFIMMITKGCSDNEASAEQSQKWKVYYTGKIIDIDPMVSHYDGKIGFMIHFNGTWIYLWEQHMVSDWPSIGETGTFYISKKEKTNIYKWEKHLIKPEPKPKFPPEIKSSPVITFINDWKNVNTSVPETDKVVVIKFKSEATSTAYLNIHKEWKLDINRENYQGGKTFTNIEKWKDIGL